MSYSKGILFLETCNSQVCNFCTLSPWISQTQLLKTTIKCVILYTFHPYIRKEGEHMSKQCFVIMPFGSASPEHKKRFDGVYRGIIVPAVREAGYEPVREDISATPGSIPKSIVTKLAEAEMVIADLTSINPNVFYELGVRHVFSKTGTVLIMNKGETIPFDNASYRVIQYTNELADLDDIHQQIVTAIRNRENTAETPDNIVHDTYPALPTNTVEYFSKDSLDERVARLQTQVTELSKENKRLRKICLDRGISLENSSESTTKSVKELIANARFALEKSGRSVMLQLRQFAVEDNINGFVDCLEGALEAGYMSENDYVHVNKLCQQLGLLPLQTAVMERAATLFPDSESIIVYLSDVYTQMPLQETRLKGVAIIEKLLDIRSVEGRYVITPPPKHVDETTLGALFNAYIRLDLHERTISVCDSYEQLDLPPLSLVIRNKASAFASLKQYDDARRTYLQLLETDYYNDANHAFYASFLDDVGDYAGAYIEREIATILDLNDANRFINLAIHMLNYSYVRTSAENLVKLKKADEVLHYAVPLFVHAIEIDGSNEKRTRVADILLRKNQTHYATAIMHHQPIDDSKLMTFPLEYILSANIDELQSTNSSNYNT